MAQLKVYSAAPNGNEAADMTDALYMNLAVSSLNEEAERLKTADTAVQTMLAHIDILLYLAEKFPEGAELSIEKSDVKVWKTAFYEWYERCNAKIPSKFREGIKDSADELFSGLETFAS